jgi:hypothetical protein
VPLTVYVVFAVGHKLTTDEFEIGMLPGAIHVYVRALLAVAVMQLPAQTGLEEAATTMAGGTVTDNEDAARQVVPLYAAICTSPELKLAVVLIWLTEVLTGPVHPGGFVQL